jgi:hypothetical protein
VRCHGRPLLDLAFETAFGGAERPVPLVPRAVLLSGVRELATVAQMLVPEERPRNWGSECKESEESLTIDLRRS